MKNTLKVEPRGDREIVMSRAFDAPRSMVYDAYTKPALVKRWLGVRSGWSMAVCEMDLRPGGAYRWVWRHVEGREMGVGGVFKEIVVHERVVATERFDDPWYEGEGLVTTTFEERGGKTLLTMAVTYESKATRDEVLKSPMESGVSDSFNEMQRVLDATRMIRKVAFTMYPVKDSKRARAFYEGTLGLAVGSHSDNGMWTEYDLPGGGCLALFAGGQSQPAANAGGTIAFEVADLDALNARLKEAGVKYQADMVHSPVCRMSVIEDSEGNAIILHELKKKH